MSVVSVENIPAADIQHWNLFGGEKKLNGIGEEFYTSSVYSQSGSIEDGISSTLPTPYLPVESAYFGMGYFGYDISPSGGIDDVEIDDNSNFTIHTKV